MPVQDMISDTERKKGVKTKENWTDLQQRNLALFVCSASTQRCLNPLKCPSWTILTCSGQEFVTGEALQGENLPAPPKTISDSPTGPLDPHTCNVMEWIVPVFPLTFAVFILTNKLSAVAPAAGATRPGSHRECRVSHWGMTSSCAFRCVF